MGSATAEHMKSLKGQTLIVATSMETLIHADELSWLISPWCMLKTLLDRPPDAEGLRCPSGRLDLHAFNIWKVGQTWPSGSDALLA